MYQINAHETFTTATFASVMSPKPSLQQHLQKLSPQDASHSNILKSDVHGTYTMATFANTYRLFNRNFLYAAAVYKLDVHETLTTATFVNARLPEPALQQHLQRLCSRYVHHRHTVVRGVARRSALRSANTHKYPLFDFAKKSLDLL